MVVLGAKNVLTVLKSFCKLCQGTSKLPQNPKIAGKLDLIGKGLFIYVNVTRKEWNLGGNHNLCLWCSTFDIFLGVVNCGSDP